MQRRKMKLKLNNVERLSPRYSSTDFLSAVKR